MGNGEEGNNELQKVDAQPIVTPVKGAVLTEAFRAYKDVQKSLDEAMKDQMMKIGGKTFRKKGYWRGVKTAFNLSVTDVTAKRLEGTLNVPETHPLHGYPDWGYRVTSIVIAPNGATMTGVGTCMWSEKISYVKEWKDKTSETVLDDNGMPQIDWPKTMDNATEHNVCGHAETRSKNRAISDLVGFGEVSAEELHQNTGKDEKTTKKAAPAKKAAPKKAAPKKEPPVQEAETEPVPKKISSAQRGRLFAIGKSDQAGHTPWTDEEMKALVLEYGYESSTDITTEYYDLIIEKLEKAPPVE